MLKKFAFIALAFSFATAAQAGTVTGTQAIAALGDVSSAPTGDITLDTVFTLNDLRTTTENTVDFATYIAGGLVLGNATLDLSDPTSFTFGNASFGTFTGISAVQVAISGVSRSFLLTGTFTPGTAFPANLRDPSVVNLALGFTQVSGPGTSISASATLVATGVPEPATMIALSTGLVFAGLVALRRKAAK